MKKSRLLGPTTLLITSISTIAVVQVLKTGFKYCSGKSVTDFRL